MKILVVIHVVIEYFQISSYSEVLGRCEFWVRDIIGILGKRHYWNLSTQSASPLPGFYPYWFFYFGCSPIPSKNYFCIIQLLLKRKSNNTSYLTMNRTRPTTQFSFTQKLLRATWWLLPSISYISQSMCNVMHVTNAQTVLDQVHPYMYPSLN